MQGLERGLDLAPHKFTSDIREITPFIHYHDIIYVLKVQQSNVRRTSMTNPNLMKPSSQQTNENKGKAMSKPSLTNNKPASSRPGLTNNRQPVVSI